MRPLQLHSERHRPEGGIDARSIRRAVGLSTLNLWELVLREALQNSWDAREQEFGPVRFAIDAWLTDSRQRELLSKVAFASTPPESRLQSALRADDLHILAITDSGTKGLAGPTRADVVSDDANDFADFVFNIGRAERKGYAGGTYGFGKAVLYEASACSTIIAFTRTKVEGSIETRLIAMAMENPPGEGRGKLTGRHWWGRQGNGVIEPLTGQDAEDLASGLGLDRLPAGSTGTVIGILQPRNDDGRTLSEIVQACAHAAAEHAWPHMIASTGHPASINFTFTCNATRIPVTDPHSDHRLRHFVDCYLRCQELLDGGVPDHDGPFVTEEVWSQRPRRRLGVLSYRRFPARTEKAFSEVALMRNPRLVVRYLPVTDHPSGQSTAGVFVAEPDLNAEFAKAEPATHDDWIPAEMNSAKYERNPVRAALRKIRGTFKRAAPFNPPSPGSGPHPGTTEFASFLGGLLDSQPGGTDTRVPSFSDFDRQRSSTGTASTAQLEEKYGTDLPGARAAKGAARSEAAGGRVGSQVHAPRPRGRREHLVRIQQPTATRLRIIDGSPIAEFEFTVHVPEGAMAVVNAEPYVLVDSGRETEAPAGADQPRVLGWHDLTNDLVVDGPVLRLTSGGDFRWAVRLTQPADAAVGVTVHATTESGMP